MRLLLPVVITRDGPTDPLSTRVQDMPNISDGILQSLVWLAGFDIDSNIQLIFTVFLRWAILGYNYGPGNSSTAKIGYSDCDTL